ncbi:two-component sensor histidine kinase [Crocosphaera subtropica ATCC 51142]|uniref:histidine kinase n=1 Tax=Crocosphaera subtropica (strain ATCC 51142 / BH68) TaxID=43989 RepID=B1WZW9_CROS5|nr:PAS domain-containing sensor histidine kinase [Crocosphaera subtropica]ACB52868.1 two-component sensor histidine kinase [Crocosphaera subtropica ATCC 51142]
MYSFILGFLLGIILLLWNRYRLKAQLKDVLTVSPDTEELLDALPALTLIKREIVYIQQQYDQQQQELNLKQQILDLAPIAYLRVDEENQLLWCNQQAQTLLQIDRWQPGQIRLLLELVRSYELDQLIEQTRQTQTPQVSEWTFYPPNYVSSSPKNQTYEAKPLNSSSVALKGFGYPLPQGQVVVFIHNQQPLVELSRSRDRALSDLTHELRTPLTSISLVSEWLEGRLQDPERRRATQMLQETHRLINLVEDWLELSQLQENPHQSLSLEPVELNEILLAAWQVVEPIAQQKQINLNTQGIEKVEISGDRSRLIQVFINLFDNSIKHSPHHSQILVNLTDNLENQTIEISILDQGSGFLEKDLPYIFNRLYRGDPSRTRQGVDSESLRTGSGLGLAIAQEIIQAHGGTITAENHPDIGGAWIQILLTKDL